MLGGAASHPFEEKRWGTQQDVFMRMCVQERQSEAVERWRKTCLYLRVRVKYAQYTSGSQRFWHATPQYCQFIVRWMTKGQNTFFVLHLHFDPSRPLGWSGTGLFTDLRVKTEHGETSQIVLFE